MKGPPIGLVGRIPLGPTWWALGAEGRLVPAKSNLKPQTYKVLLPVQHGGLRKHQCSDHILHVKAKYPNVTGSYAPYIDFNKAFNSVPHRELFQVLEHNGFSTAAIDIIKRLYSTPLDAPIINGQTPVQYFQRRGVRQGCPLSPLLFNLYLNALLAHFMATHLPPPNNT